MQVSSLLAYTEERLRQFLRHKRFASDRVPIYTDLMHLNGVMLYVKDLPRMAAFYEDALNLKPNATTTTDAWMEFSFGTIKFALHAIPAQYANEIEISSPPQAREDSPTKLLFEVADVDLESKRLESLGAVVLRRPWRTCDVLDPEGNIFQIQVSTS